MDTADPQEPEKPNEPKRPTNPKRQREPKMLDFLPRGGFYWPWLNISPQPPKMLRSKNHENRLVRCLASHLPSNGARLTKKLVCEEMAYVFRNLALAAQKDGTRIEEAPDLLVWLKGRVCETFWAWDIPRMVWVELIWRFVEARLIYTNNLDANGIEDDDDLQYHSELTRMVQAFIGESEDAWDRDGGLIEAQLNPAEQMEQEFRHGDWMPNHCESWKEWALSEGDKQEDAKQEGNGN